MGKKKTSNRGRKPKDEADCTYVTLTTDQKAEYHRTKDKLRHGRTPSTSTSSKSPPSTPKRPRGRPTIMGITAMTPDTLRRRASYLNSEKRKKDRRIKRSIIANAAQYSDKLDDMTTSDDDVELASVDGDDNDSHDVLNSDSDDNGDDGTDVGDLPGRTTLWRAKCKLRGILTNNAVDNMLLMLTFNNIENELDVLTQELTKLKSLNIDVRKYRYRIARLKEFFKYLRQETKNEVIKFWLENILSSSAVESMFQSVGVNIPIHLLPKSIKVSRHAAVVSKQYLRGSSQSSYEIRKNAISYIVDVAKDCELSSRDADTLSSATNCSLKFAHRVLEAIDKGTVDELLKLRRERIDSMHVTKWPQLISEFVFRPENARAVPGQETVSVRYGVPKPKFLLLKSRDDIAKEFKLEHPTCDFGLSVIKREFPQNAITPSARDKERNTCPVHANARRITKCINKAFRKHKVTVLPHSCRELSMSVMCPNESVKMCEPVTWKRECAAGTCKNCPKFTTECPNELSVKTVKFSLWESKKVNVTKTDKNNVTTTKEKTVFALYPYETTLQEAIERLSGMISGLKLHIYTAHRQWSAHDIQRSNMDPSSVITIEDYQMNMEVVYTEAPTSLAYSSNKKSVAMYPLCVEFVREDGCLGKGGIVFLSEDKIHDHQQVEAFEKRAFEIFADKLPNKIKSWKRYSDGCGAQFWSRYVNAGIFKMKEQLNLENISYDRFAAHEGKSASDTLGSITKCCFNRALFKSEEGISSISDIVALIKSELKESTKKFDFLVVEEFGSTQRLLERNELVIPRISKLHSVTLINDAIIAKEWSCTECRVSKLCNDCVKIKSISKSVMKKGSNDSNDDDDDTNEEQNFDTLYDDDDEGKTDESDSDMDSTDEDDEKEIQPGDLVWGLLGRIWYPGKVCQLSELPEDLHNKFNNVVNKFIVYWYGDNMYSAVKRVEKLGETRMDAHRASRSKEMVKLYNMALSDL